MGRATRKTDDANSLFIREHDCERHGPYLQFVTADCGSPRCPVCINGSDSLHFLPRFGVGNESRNAQQMRALSAAGVPQRFLDCRFSNFFPVGSTQIGALHAVEAYCANFGIALADSKNLVMVGSTGTGKTHLGVAALAQVMLRGCSIRYADARKRSSLRTRKVLPDLTLIDNVGLALDSVQAIQNLLMDRYDAAKPTIVLGSVDRDALPALFGDLCMDRLREGGAKILQFGWESYRRAKQSVRSAV